MERRSGPLVDASGLVKDYGNVRALSDLSLRVMPGEVYGLLGPNGAGKTTTLRILTGLDSPTAGRVRVVGFDPSTQAVEVKKRVGYVAETAILYESLTPREYFEFIVSTRKLDGSAVERASTLADAFDLESHFDAPIGALSLGTKQKIAVIAAFLHSPLLLLLDEPLNGLDAKSARILKELVLIHTEKGGAVVFSTHIMEVAQAMCTRIGILNLGRIVADGTMEELRAMAGRRDSSLEDLFLKLTDEEGIVADTIGKLREDARNGPQ